MPDAAAELDALADEFYAVWFRYHPDLALAAGVPEFASLLPAQDDDDLAALGGWLEALILGLDEVDYGSLDADRRMDFELMAGAARVEHRELLYFDWRRRDPLHFLPMAEIHRLTLEPPDGLRDQLACLLAAVPEYLRQAQGQLGAGAEHLAVPLVRAAALDAESGRCYLRDLVRSPWLRRQGLGIAEIESLAEEACDALADYREYLLGELVPRSCGVLGCGAKRLASRLGELHFIDVDLDVGRDALVRALARVEGELARSSDRADAGGVEGQAAGDASDRQRRRRPELPYGALCEGLAREISASGLVSLPSAPLRVGLRPPCPQSQRLWADYRADDEAGGTLFLPSLAGTDIDDPVDWICARCLAQGWGGSHLLAWSDPGRARRTPRRLANGASLGVGWSLYLERCLADRPDSPGRRLAALRRQREHLLLALLDLDVNGGGTDGEGPLDRLGALGLDGPAADQTLARVATAPGDALAGGLGWLLLEAAREESGREQGAELALRRFHDRLVSQGRVPLALVLRHGFGESLAGRVFDRAFGV